MPLIFMLFRSKEVMLASVYGSLSLVTWDWWMFDWHCWGYVSNFLCNGCCVSSDSLHRPVMLRNNKMLWSWTIWQNSARKKNEKEKETIWYTAEAARYVCPGSVMLCKFLKRGDSGPRAITLELFIMLILLIRCGWCRFDDWCASSKYKFTFEIGSTSDLSAAVPLMSNWR